MIDRIARQLRLLPLQRRISLLAALAVALAVATTGIAGYLTARYSLYHQLDSELTNVASLAAVSVAGDLPTLGGLNSNSLHAANVTIVVVRANGAIYRVPGERVQLPVGEEDLAIARMHQGSAARSAYAPDGTQYRIVAVPIPNLKNYALVLGRDLEPTNRILSALWLVLILSGVSGVIWAGFIGSAVARSGLGPVRRLTAAVEHVAATDELAPIQVTGNDELSRLAMSFNQMLDSLAVSRERQRQLIADAGHELRTPLTSLRTNIELLLSDAESQLLPLAARTEILTDVNAQLAEFTTLIQDLVQLAREDSVVASPEPIDFRTVVTNALERARRRGPGLVFDVELNALYIIGESDTLERAITNLLDNAVKWSPPGGTIRVHLEGDRLRISDQGPGIDEADLPFIFDRFYRTDTSRNTPGTGLGLSIVAQAVTRHGGWVKASRSAEGGAQFTVSLPGSTTLAGLAESDPNSPG